MVCCAPLAAGTPRSAGHHASSLPAGEGTNKLTAVGARRLSAAQAAPRRRLHSLALPLAACRLRLQKVRRHESREFCTQPIDRRFEGMIQHIAHHDHTAWHPLAPAAQFPVCELGHRAFAIDQGVEQSHHCIDTDAVTLGKCGDFCCPSGVSWCIMVDPLHSGNI